MLYISSHLQKLKHLVLFYNEKNGRMLLLLVLLMSGWCISLLAWFPLFFQNLDALAVMAVKI